MFEGGVIVGMLVLPAMVACGMTIEWVFSKLKGR